MRLGSAPDRDGVADRLVHAQDAPSRRGRGRRSRGLMPPDRTIPRREPSLGARTATRPPARAWWGPDERPYGSAGLHLVVVLADHPFLGPDVAASAAGPGGRGRTPAAVGCGAPCASAGRTRPCEPVARQARRAGTPCRGRPRRRLAMAHAKASIAGEGAEHDGLHVLGLADRELERGLTASAGTAATMRSWASLIQISKGSRPAYLSGAADRGQTSAPTCSPISPTALENPPAPQSVTAVK